MKRLITGIMVLFLLFCSATIILAEGQGEGETKTEKVVVKTMAYGEMAQAEGQSWVRIVEAFEKENPNIDIDFEMLYDEAYHNKVTARLAGGDVPDLAYMGADARWGTPWKEAGQQFDHRPYMDTNYYDMNLIPAMGPNGEIWEIPLGTNNICTVLYMNKALVESLGFSTPQTYEDLVAMVPAAKAAGLDVVSIDGADSWAWGSCLMSCIIARLSGDANWVSKAFAGQYKFTDQVFVDSLAMITRMVNDGVIDSKMVLVDYGANLSNFSTGKALFMVQGQWAAGSIDPAVADNTVMLAWPKFPGEKSNMAGSVAAAIQVGYGITKAGAEDPAVRDAALKFIQFFYSEAETTQRLRDGAIMYPILKGYQLPDDLPSIVNQKPILVQTALNTDVIDAFLSGDPNDALNSGMQKIATGEATAAQIAAQVEKLLRP